MITYPSTKLWTGMVQVYFAPLEVVAVNTKTAHSPYDWWQSDYATNIVEQKEGVSRILTIH